MQRRRTMNQIKNTEVRGDYYKMLDSAIKALSIVGSPVTKENIISCCDDIPVGYLEEPAVQKRIDDRVKELKKMSTKNPVAADVRFSKLLATIKEMKEADIDLTEENICELYGVGSDFLSGNSEAKLIVEAAAKGLLGENFFRKDKAPIVSKSGTTNQYLKKVKEAIAGLKKAGKKVTFSSVANASGVSSSFLNSNEEAKKMIEDEKVVVTTTPAERRLIVGQVIDEIISEGSKLTVINVAKRAGVPSHFIYNNKELFDKITNANQKTEASITETTVVLEKKAYEFDSIDIRFLKDIIDCVIVEKPAKTISVAMVAELSGIDAGKIAGCVEIKNYIDCVNSTLAKKAIIDRTLKQIVEMRKAGQMINLYTVVRNSKDNINLDFIKENTEILEFIENNRSL